MADGLKIVELALVKAFVDVVDAFSTAPFGALEGFAMAQEKPLSGALNPQKRRITARNQKFGQELAAALSRDPT